MTAAAICRNRAVAIVASPPARSVACGGCSAETVVTEASMESLSGKLLVASPRLNDPNFSRTVVLLVEHDRGGALGLVLNRPGNQSLDSMWDDLVDGACPQDLAVLVGGPLEGPLLALHADSTLAERGIVPGVFLAMRKDLIVSLVVDGSRPLRVFAGYSGWGAGQLESELAADDWAIADATSDFVFGDADSLWQRVTTRIADTKLARALRIKHVPAEPWHN
jgi:putative transcriptional regulator